MKQNGTYRRMSREQAESALKGTLNPLHRPSRQTQQAKTRKTEKARSRSMARAEAKAAVEILHKANADRVRMKVVGQTGPAPVLDRETIVAAEAVLAEMKMRSMQGDRRSAEIDMSKP
jgi:hypothetical protein